MKTIPIDVLIHWPIPNYNNPERNSEPEVIIHLIFLAITLPIVLFRLYARYHSSRKLGYDDLFCGLGMFIAIAFTTACLISAFRYDSGVHMWDVQPQFWTQNLKVGMVGKILFVSSGACVRQSLLSFYHRLVDSAHIRNFTIALWAMTFANWASCIVFNAIDVFMCNPAWAYWNYPSDAYGTCLDEGVAVMSCGAIIAVIDMIILTMPIPLIAKLQMPRRRKIGICFLLSMGLVATIAAVLRVWFSYKAFVVTYDLGWWVTTLWICAAFEIYIALMCSCAPAIRTYFHENQKSLGILGRIFTSRCGSERTDGTNDEKHARDTTLESFSTYCLEKGSHSHAGHAEKGMTYDAKNYTGSYDSTAHSGSITNQLREQSSSSSIGEEYPIRYTPDGAFGRDEGGGTKVSNAAAATHAATFDFGLPKETGGLAQEDRPFAKRTLSSAWAARQEANMIAAKQARKSAGKTPSIASSISDRTEESYNNNENMIDHESMHEPETAVEVQLSPKSSVSWRGSMQSAKEVTISGDARTVISSEMDRNATFLDEDSIEGDDQAAELERVEAARRYRVARQRLSSLRSAG